MKKIFLSLLFVMSIGIASAQNPGIRLLNEGYDQLTISVVTPSVNIEEQVFLGQKFSSINIDGYLPSTQVGDPMLPILGQMIELPVCDATSIEVVSAEYDTIYHAVVEQVYPAQPSRSKSDKAQYATSLNQHTYNSNAFFGFELASFEYIGIARDVILGRVSFSPVRYNPQTGDIIVCTKATIKVHFQNSNPTATDEMKQRYHSSAFNIGVETLNHFATKEASAESPIRMLIVSDSTFRNQIQDYVTWKRRKGFMVDVVYNSDTAVGRTQVKISRYIKRQFTEATKEKPAPTFLLLIGDVAQIPSCTCNYPANYGWYTENHVTDLYYAEWTGDMLPECYYGRFSAQTHEQLQPQLDKTMMYEKYEFPDPTFLTHAVLTAGQDNGRAGDFGYSHADPTMDYIARNYLNGSNGFTQVRFYKNNVNSANTPTDAPNLTVMSNNQEDSVVFDYNEGAGIINYSAHGEWDRWHQPLFKVSDVNNMRNEKKFGIMIGNCCLTNKFEKNTCLGEALLRKDNYCGAVDYIGGSNVTYWDEDVYWAVGVRQTINQNTSFQYDSTHMGVYDQLFHLHGESPANWITSVGGMLMAGNMSVQSSTSTLRNYYWEIYHIMGDPSVQPWLGLASSMQLVTGYNYVGDSVEVYVSAVPYAYVAVTKNGQVVTAGYADANGIVYLHLAAGQVGTYEVAASAMGYKTAFRPLYVYGYGVEDCAVSNVSLSPNPSKNYVEVSAPALSQVMIMDASGREVLKVKANSDVVKINLQSLPKGIYFVKIATQNASVVKKLVKE